MNTRVPTYIPVPSPLITGESEEGQDYTSWRPEGTRDWLLLYTMGGAGRITSGSSTRLLGPHEAVLFRPETAQDYCTDPSQGSWSLIWAHFLAPAHWTDWLQWPEWKPGIGMLSLEDRSERQAVARSFRQAHRLRTGPHPGGAELAKNAFEEVLIRCAILHRKQDRTVADPRVLEVVHYIGDHLEEDLSAEALSRRAGLSPVHFSRLFREATGSALQPFVETRRLNRARELLLFTQLSIKEIAYRLGFSSPYYFSLRFKKETGYSPSGYRSLA